MIPPVRATLLFCCAPAALVWTSSPALSQDTAPDPEASEASQAKVFEPAYFERFAPRTAYDMLVQVPGFQIRSEEERRGLGQSTGNIVINGRRVSGKSNDAVTELARIPASRVQRIEIVEGSTLDVPGLSGQVANVIVQSGGLGGTYEWRPAYGFAFDRLRPFGGGFNLSASTRTMDFTLGFDSQNYAGGGIGPERVIDGAGALVDLREEAGEYFGHSQQVTGSVKYTGTDGQIGNANILLARAKGFNVEVSERSGPDVPDRVRAFDISEASRQFELGGDYEEAVLGGRLKVIGLARVSHSQPVSVVRESFADSRPQQGQRVVGDSTLSEYVSRSELRWKEKENGDWQVSLEAAKTELDNVSEFALLTPAGVFMPIAFPGASAVVTERRAEAILTHGRRLATNLDLNVSAGGEYSNIRQSGAGGLDRTFYRPKGSAVLAWRPDRNTSLSGKLAREVGQLSFNSFLASVNLATGNGSLGNPQLVPQQTWLIELQGNKRFGEWGRADLRLYSRFIEDIVDTVPIGNDGESAGNLESAQIYGFAFTGTLQTDPLGLAGGRLDASVQLQSSSVEDPVRLQLRPISGTLRRRIDLRFRRDQPRSDWAYGASYLDRRNNPNFRLTERSLLYVPQGLGVFVENKDVAGVKVRLDLANLLQENEVFDRTVFARRSDGPVQFNERRERESGVTALLTVSGRL